jgi:5-methylcytosine-specific restriction protein A
MITVARRRALTVCSVPGCPTLTDTGRCPEHRAEAERARGTARQRGYGRGHETRFRPAVLARDPVCVLCQQAPSVHADHYPLSRRELVAAGLDPDDPRHGRGLCGPCHSRHTAQEQPGGWHK